jgi:hypothetical protein
MSEIVNLNRFRKQRARQERQEEAAENRVRFGTPKADRVRERTIAEQDAARLEGHRIERPDER